MSTAGKVLTVLILLVMVVWLVMMSAVSQLNANYAEKLQNQQKQLDEVIAKADKATSDYYRYTAAGRFEQDTTDRDVRVLMGKIAGIESRKSSHIENLTRVKVQLDSYLVAVENAKANLATREAEKATIQDDLAKKLVEIGKAKTLNADLRTQLAQLQDEFKRILAENTAAVTKAKEKGPAAKPASSRRESPAS